MVFFMPFEKAIDGLSADTKGACDACSVTPARFQNPVDGFKLSILNEHFLRLVVDCKSTMGGASTDSVVMGSNWQARNTVGASAWLRTK